MGGLEVEKDGPGEIENQEKHEGSFDIHRIECTIESCVNIWIWWFCYCVWG